MGINRTRKNINALWKHYFHLSWLDLANMSFGSGLGRVKFGLVKVWVTQIFFWVQVRFGLSSVRVKFGLSSGWSNLVLVRFRFELSSVWVNFGWTKFESGSISDRLKFGSGELQVKLTRIGLGTGRVKIGFSRFWLWVWVNVGSGRNRIGLNSKHVTSG